MRSAERGTRITHLPAVWRRGLVSLGLLTTVSWTLLATAAHDAPLNPDDPAYLRRQYTWFLHQDPARQQQIRKLHADFQSLGPEDQARLVKVMQAYSAWLARLPEADRGAVLAARNPTARLDAVRELRERDWVQALPRPYREEYAQLDETARRLRVQEWRADEAERREEWDLAQRHWAGNPTGRLPANLQNEGRPLFEAFVGHLRENLSEPERRMLDEAQAKAEEPGHSFFPYLFEVVRLSDRRTVLPGKVGPKDFDSLPEAVRNYLVKHDPQHFKKKGITPSGGEELKEMRRAQGRWPAFAVELSDYCQRKKLALPEPLGDCRKDQMPPEVVKFLNDTLEPRLRQTPDGRADLKVLEEAQGKWPDYPRAIVDLSRKHKLPIPGWTLPGPAQAWDAFRAGKNRGK